MFHLLVISNAQNIPWRVYCLESQGYYLRMVPSNRIVNVYLLYPNGEGPVQFTIRNCIPWSTGNI